MNKATIRKEYSLRRLTLSDEEVIILSTQIVELFRSLKLDGVQTLLSYSPITRKREFDPGPCEQLHLLNNPQANIALPKMDMLTLEMEAIAISLLSEFSVNSYGIAEPEGSNIISPQLIDAVFVPLLAFDIKGYRVGYGKGFYDRYFARCAPDVVRIGFSFFEALPAIRDINQFDVPLKYCITPSRLYEF